MCNFFCRNTSTFCIYYHISVILTLYSLLRRYSSIRIYFMVIISNILKGTAMIDYSPFWETLKKTNENWYTLTSKHHMSHSTLHRLKHNQDISMKTVNDLCRILHCQIQDICVYVPSDEDQPLWWYIMLSGCLSNLVFRFIMNFYIAYEDFLTCASFVLKI